MHVPQIALEQNGRTSGQTCCLQKELIRCSQMQVSSRFWGTRLAISAADVRAFNASLRPNRVCRVDKSNVRSVQLCSEYEGYRTALMGLDAQALREQARSMPSALSLDFLLWLADREGDADGEEGEQLTALCRQLTAIREGLEPDQAEDAASAQLRALAAQPAPPGRAGLLELGARWRALTAQASSDAQACLSLEAALLAEQQVLQMNEGVRAARATSAVELMGRKMLQADDQAATADPVMTPADPAARILEALLVEPDQAARFAMLPDAFTPPEPPQEVMQDDTGDEEQLSTSPIQLIQAIDLALRRMAPGGEGAQQQHMVLPGSHAGGSTHDDIINLLRAMRAEVFRIWTEDA